MPKNRRVLDVYCWKSYFMIKEMRWILSQASGDMMMGQDLIEFSVPPQEQRPEPKPTVKPTKRESEEEILASDDSQGSNFE